MLYPLLIKRIIRKIRTTYEDLLILKEGTRYEKQYSEWIAEYFDLDVKDQENIIKKFERSQTRTIIESMRRGDREIFINQLGVFYIKATTIDYYNSLKRLTEEEGYEYNEAIQLALDECRAEFIKRDEFKKHAKETKHISIKV